MAFHTFPKSTKYPSYSTEISLAYDKLPYKLINITVENGLRAFETARNMIGRDYIVDEKPTLVGSDIFVLIFCSVVVASIFLISVHVREKFLMGRTLPVGLKPRPFLCLPGKLIRGHVSKISVFTRINLNRL